MNRFKVILLFLIILTLFSFAGWYYSIVPPDLMIILELYLFACLPIMLFAYLAMKQPVLLSIIIVVIMIVCTLVSAMAISAESEYANWGRGFLVALFVFGLISFASWNTEQKNENPRYGAKALWIFLYILAGLGIWAFVSMIWGIAFILSIPTVILSVRIIKLAVKFKKRGE